MVFFQKLVPRTSLILENGPKAVPYRHKIREKRISCGLWPKKLVFSTNFWDDKVWSEESHQCGACAEKSNSTQIWFLGLSNSPLAFFGPKESHLKNHFAHDF